MKKTVIAYLQTHWDREWYREKEEFNLRLLEVFDEVLKELETGAAPCFYFDGQTSAINDYLKFRPEKLSEIKKLIKEKKLYVGPFFVSADAFMTDLRCLIKNLEDGLRYSKRLGCKDFIGYLPDIFGHTRAVFEALNLYDIKNAVIWRGTGAIEADMKVRSINTTRLVEGYFVDILHHNLPAPELAKNIEILLDKIAKYSGDTLLLPLGGDHLAIIKNSSQKIKEINNYLEKYEIKLDCPFEYFKKAQFGGKKSYDGEFLDNSENYILGGVYSSRISQKVQNAKLMHKITRLIEPLNCFLGLNYKPNIDFAYITLLKNHAHDSIYGCSTDAVARAVDDRFGRIDEILCGLEKRIIRDMDGNTKTPCAVGVMNMSNFKNTGVVKFVSEYKVKNAQVLSKRPYFCDSKLYNPNDVPVTEDILTLYEQIVEVEPQEPFSYYAGASNVPQKLTATGENFIENPNLKLWVEDKKINIEDKKTGKIYYDFIKIIDTKDDGDSYNYAPASRPKTLDLKRTKPVCKGKIQSKLRLYFKDIELDVILNNKSEFFEFEAKINNKNKNHKLQVAFNLENPVDTTFACDNLGIIKRVSDPDYCLFENEPAVRPKELKTNSYPMQGFVFAQNTGVLGEGLYEYEIYKNELRLCLLRATGIISNPKNAARSIPAGPPLFTPELQCLGLQEVRFGLYFGKDKEEMYRIKEQFFKTYIAFLGSKKMSKVLYKAPKGTLFCGVTDKNEAILCDIIKEKLILKKLAKAKKVL